MLAQSISHPSATQHEETIAALSGLADGKINRAFVEEMLLARGRSRTALEAAIRNRAQNDEAARAHDRHRRHEARQDLAPHLRLVGSW